MQIKEEKKIYAEAEKCIDIHQTLQDGIHFKLFVEFPTEKFADYQKDLIQEFAANFVDTIQNSDFDIDQVKSQCELSLQDLNTRLKAFADKVRDVDYFEIKWYVQIIIGNLLVSSMIGNVDIMIFRDRRMYYSLNNWSKIRGKIALFSEFIEGDLESGDEIIYVGTKVSDVLDTYDLKEMEHILQTEESTVMDFIDEVLSSRIEKSAIGFLMNYIIRGSLKQNKIAEKINLGKLTTKLWFIQEWKGKFLKNKYQTTVAILSLFIAFMLWSLLSQLFKAENKEVYVNSQGVTVDLTIEDIKKDIVLFKSMDSAGDEKGMKYQEILNKLNVLETKWRWVEDIAQLKNILKADYYKGFNIITMNSLSQFDDAVAGKKTTVFTFNQAEKDKLWTLSTIDYQKDIMIAWSSAALLWTTSETSRGALIEYGIDDAIKGCSLSLLKNGFYCYTSNGKIYLMSKAWVEAVTTGDPDGFPTNIWGVGTYGKANMYVFAQNITDLSNSTFVTRYRNTLGSQSIYQQGQKYMVNPGLATGLNFGSGFTNFAIDVNFLARSEGKLYQFRRNPATSLTLTYREIKLLGGDKMTSKYGNNVRIITPANSRYVYLRDKDNQTFTVYESRPLKTNDLYATNYNLYYLFRFSFDLGVNKVVDIAVPDATGDRQKCIS